MTTNPGYRNVWGVGAGLAFERRDGVQERDGGAVVWNKEINTFIRINMWYHFLNIFFFVFHTILTLFNCIGWAFRATRKWNLVTLLLTAGSWFILGIWYGWGYCLCTDWHWRVRRHLGYHDESRSYIHFLILKLTGANLDPQLVERGTLLVFIISLILSIWLNVRDARAKRGKRG